MITIRGDGPEFHLSTTNSSYIFTILPNGLPGTLHFGGQLSDGRSYRHLGAFTTSRYIPLCDQDDFPEGFLPDEVKTLWKQNPSRASLSASRVRMEYSSVGRGDFRMPAFLVRLGDGSHVTRFRYDRHTLIESLPRLPGLPYFDMGTSHGKDDTPQTLEVTFLDQEAGLELRLYWAVIPDSDAILRWSKLSNTGKAKIEILSLASLSTDFPQGDYDMIYLEGSVNRERNFCRNPLSPGRHLLGSAGGTSGSWWHNPFIALAEKGADENHGKAWGFNLAYSGNFTSGMEVDPFGVVRVQTGLSSDMFRWVLEPGQEFVTPQAIAVYSDRGLTGLSQSMHDLIRDHFLAPAWRKKTMPIVCNSWEGNYFNIDSAKLHEQAKHAAQLGAEIFVIDDGWFGTRDDDTSSLGDWYPHKKKFPEGLAAFSKTLAGMGLGLGLWFEPEMISEESNLYKSHPEYCIKTSRYAPLSSRNQYVLDFSDVRVVDRLFDDMSKAIRDAGLAYIKWDMNRMMSDFFSNSLSPERQGEFFHRYILGVYSLYERLVSAFPNLLIESCASGGGRFDLGLLRWAPMAWTSDNTDPLSRIGIQLGTSLAYPLRTMSAHISSSPNHQVARMTRPGFRGAVALFASFGFELNPTTADTIELKAISRYAALYNEYRELIANGDFFRLTGASSGSGDLIAWMVLGKDKRRALCGIYLPLQRADPAFRSIRLKGLDAGAQYTVEFIRDHDRLKQDSPAEAMARAEALAFMHNRIVGGDELMETGILVDDNLPWIRESLLSGDADCDYILVRLDLIESQNPR